MVGESAWKKVANDCGASRAIMVAPPPPPRPGGGGGRGHGIPFFPLVCGSGWEGGEDQALQLWVGGCLGGSIVEPIPSPLSIPLTSVGWTGQPWLGLTLIQTWIGRFGEGLSPQIGTSRPPPVCATFWVGVSRIWVGGVQIPSPPELLNQSLA